MKYIVKCRIDFADGDYSIEDYNGEIYETKEEAETAADIAKAVYGLDAWVVAVEEGD